MSEEMSSAQREKARRFLDRLNRAREHRRQTEYRTALHEYVESLRLFGAAAEDVIDSVTASLGFRSPEGACRTIEEYEAMHAIRKGQIRWVAKGDPVGQRQFIHSIFGVAA